jgi:hypothetical protein
MWGLFSRFQAAFWYTMGMNPSTFEGWKDDRGPIGPQPSRLEGQLEIVQQLGVDQALHGAPFVVKGEGRVGPEHVAPALRERIRDLVRSRLGKR